MRGGKLRHRLAFYKPVEGQPNEFNELVPGYQYDFSLWGEVNDLSGLELVRAQAKAAESAVRVTVRHRPGITVGHLIEHGERELEIVAVLDTEGRDREMTLLCKEDV